ncbi:NAD(P)H-hydrate epimerase [Levilactobacillus brevis]|uniref:NAD(P)H-hydrate epimerase n=1 Tax=Levilactobacillus brevis TaxID=1580 RepID=UPI001C1F14FB|nr:NAD(P)H-hydrate epimerase [Levilactobacillus brevis]MBU7539200.1 NAD(P)H-hydrate epimerase [Levilactobacillus brevis]MBU7558704.1 NAD(P)H-hydrate epimerase [Levilactobacillus brevis]MBU7565337.1 NAD(P)H-hydrate epimerase [Levilactobacillus brevis]MCE6010236.1 NAD(P)H-hydrate epimerase [Levilactobacillus brevis]MCE6012643.1 NAD(P)H-hydrate epimerase [Levilactobacillus brevis]
MSKAITIAEAQRYDAHATNVIGIPAMVLMERAALATFNNLLNDDFDLDRVVVVAATGNNGGDGIAVARLLKIRGIDVTIYLLGDPENATPQTSQQLKIANYYNIPITIDLNQIVNATLIVDAIFGVGLTRDVTGNFADAINAINAADAKTVAIDVPSGINADTGAVMGVAVVADSTTTMAYNKIGLLTTVGKQHAGAIHVADIGIYAQDRVEHAR